MKIIAIPFGTHKAHPVNQEWFKSVGVTKSKSFTGFNSRKIVTKYPFISQILGFIHSILMPKADVYLLTSVASVISVVLNKKLFGSKIITVNSDTFYKDLKNARGIRKLYMKWLVKHVDAIISTSNMMKNISSKFTNVPNEVVYPFCNVEKFEKNKYNANSINICSIGLGISTKGTDILYKVFDNVKRKISNSKLYALGDLIFIKNIKKPKDCINPGVVDPLKYICDSGVYVNTSRHESFGVNIIEAMCAGLPVIATKNCGASELISPHYPELITSLDPIEISEKIISLLNKKEKKKKIGKHLKKIGKEFTKEKSISDFKNTFYTLLKKIK